MVVLQAQLEVAACQRSAGDCLLANLVAAAQVQIGRSKMLRREAKRVVGVGLEWNWKKDLQQAA